VTKVTIEWNGTQEELFAAVAFLATTFDRGTDSGDYADIADEASISGDGEKEYALSSAVVSGLCDITSSEAQLDYDRYDPRLSIRCDNERPS